MTEITCSYMANNKYTYRLKRFAASNFINLKNFQDPYLDNLFNHTCSFAKY